MLPPPFSGHLWFLKYLFLISLVALPLLSYLRSKQGIILIDKIATWCDRQGGIFIVLIPLILVRVGLRSIFWGGHTWADFFEFVIFFVIGYMLPVNTRFTKSIMKHTWICLVFGLAGSTVQAIFVLGVGYNYPAGESFSATYILFEIVMSIGRWSWIVFVMGLGARYLNFRSAVLDYCNEAVLPFYIFHQTIILCVGWFVINRDIGILPKYLIIAVASFAIIMGLYDLIVKRFNTTRFFFGMRPRKIK